MEYTKTAVFIVLTLLIFQTSASPSRVRRQSFGWGDYEDLDQSTPQRQQRPSTPASNPPSSTSAGTTTTTPSPQYSNCIRNCPTTPQYNPICGTNRITYPNESHLRCANNCGLNVQRAFGGTCQPL